MRRPLLLAALLAIGAPVEAQDIDRPARDLYSGIPVPDLEFDPPEADRFTLSNGVQVFHLRDATLPLVSVFARFKGGPSNHPRSRLAAATAVPQLLRSGGTGSIPADSIDRAFEYYAAETTFGSGGQSSFASVNTLSRNLAPVLELWFAVMREPAFDPARVEVWRGQELEAVRRRLDSPGSLAISEYNRLMYGDHPIGWEMAASDLEPAKLSPEVLRDVHGSVFCTGNLTLGVAGDATWDEVEPLLESAMRDWPDCTGELIEPPLADFRTEPGVYVIRKDLAQSTLIAGHPSDVRLADDRSYYASRIANSILGAGGFTSRLVSTVRTELGLAYSVASVWTTPLRSQGIVGAITQTRPDATGDAGRAIVDVFEELITRAPEAREVDDTVERIRNGFVFNFHPSTVVSRQMAYLSQGLPLDWLERYLAGVQRVRVSEVHRVFRDTLDPGKLVFLVLGDPDAFEIPEEWGPVTEITPGG